MNKWSRNYWGKRGASVIPMAGNTCRFLIEKRSSDVEESGTWGLIGGRIENNESYEDGAKRELFEETGYRDDNNLIPMSLFVDADFAFQNFISIVPNEFTPKISWESDEMRWLTYRQLNNLPNKHFGLKMVLHKDGERLKRMERNCKIANKIS